MYTEPRRDLNGVPRESNRLAGKGRVAASWSSLLAAGILTFQFVALSCAAGPFQVEGLFVMEPLDPAGRVIETNVVRSSFAVAVNGSEWLIKAFEGSGEYYHLYGCDGTNTYSLLCPAKPVPNSYAVPGYVDAGVYPITSSTMIVKLPWLAFASTQYLDRSPTNMPAPWAIGRVDAAAYVFGCATALSPIEPRLLEKMTFQVQGSLLKSAPKNPNLETERHNRETQARFLDALGVYHDGFIGGEYSVLSWTNVAGLHVPLEARFKRYAPERSGSPNQGLFEVYTLSVTNVSDKVLGSYLPPLEYRTRITDSRLKAAYARIDYVTYSLTNDAWPTQITPALRQLYEAKKINGPGHLPENGRVARPLVLAILAITLFTPVFLLRKQSKTKQTKG